MPRLAATAVTGRRLPSFLVRKCLVVLLVIIFTCFTVHMKARLKTTVRDGLFNGEEESAEIGNPSRRAIDLNEEGAQVAPIEEETKVKSYFEYDGGLADTREEEGEQTAADDDGAAGMASKGFEVDLLREEDGDDPYRSRKLQQTKKESKSKESNKTATNTTEKKGKGHLKVSPSTVSSTKSPVLIKLLEASTNSCTNPAYMEFPTDLFGNRARSRGAVIVHIAVVLYMFYCLAIVCENYFLPSLEECVHRLNLSQDVAGATFMAAGSSAPELFTAILGVFIAKGDVGTGTIVGSAVFNILFVIGLCSLYTVSTQLNWWPVARDSAYYTFTVFLLICFIYDGEVTTLESFIMLFFYGVYILIMNNNIRLRDFVLQIWETHFQGFQNGGPKPMDELNNLNKSNALQAVHYQSFQGGNGDVEYGSTTVPTTYNTTQNPFIVRMPEITVFEAANQVIIMHKRLFRGKTRFRAAAYLVIIRSKKAKQKKDNFYSELNRAMSTESARKMSRLGPDENFWRTIPDPNVDGVPFCAKWLVQAPLHAALHYTIPDCKAKSSIFLFTFFASITWTAIFSYVMVWMVTLIGFTFGIPDSIMGITFLAAGTSVPDAYASLHVAKLGQADMAVSNSIGSNVFDILVGLALPWFVETAFVDTGSVSTINSRGLVYAVVLLFLSLVITIYLFHLHRWTLSPKLGYALLSTYVVFIVFSSALEFNLFGYVNPPICGE